LISPLTGTLQTEDGSDELALKKLFMRIDANSDDTIDWDVSVQHKSGPLPLLLSLRG